MRRRISPSAAVTVTISTVALYSITAVASPAAQAAPPSGVHSSASGEVLHVGAVAVPGLSNLADVGIGIVDGTVDGNATRRSFASARNLDLALADQALPDLLAVAEQAAPPDHATADTVTTLPGSVPGLLDLGVSTATAQARWDGDSTCLPPAAALSSSSVSTADAGVQPGGDLGSLLGLPGNVSVGQTTQLVPNADTVMGGRDVVVTATGSTASLGVFGEQLEVDVTDAPTLTATATGRPGGAAVVWNAPALDVTFQGETQTVPADGTPLDFTSPDNPLLHVELRAGQLTDVVTSADGLRASGNASVLELQFTLGAAPLALPILEADMFPLSVSATAPVGGVQCGPSTADTDGDGLTDVQEMTGSANNAYGHLPTDPTKADSDGDGLKDGQEITLGTNPNDPDTDDGTVPDGTEVHAGTDPLDPADDVASQSQDPDGDGLTTAVETELGTDPLVADTDRDGLNDGREVKHTRTDPLDKDTDNDGLGDGREVNQIGTNPRKKDSDRDQLSDGREVKGASAKYPRCSTDPLDKDTDNDKLTDGQEVKRYRTNPCDRDSDNGGVSDGKEVAAGSDPLDHHSTPKNPRLMD